MGDAAEALVRCLLARDGLDVYGAGKWLPDVAVVDSRSRMAFLVEVRSTFLDKPPARKATRKLSKAQVLAIVRFELGEDPYTATVEFKKLQDGRIVRGVRTTRNPKPKGLVTWLRREGIIGPRALRVAQGSGESR
jgi:hypothetical protein